VTKMYVVTHLYIKFISMLITNN